MSVSTLSPPLPTPVALYAGKADFFLKKIEYLILLSVYLNV